MWLKVNSETVQITLFFFSLIFSSEIIFRGTLLFCFDGGCLARKGEGLGIVALLSEWARRVEGTSSASALGNWDSIEAEGFSLFSGVLFCTSF